MENIIQLVPFDKILKEFSQLYVQEYGLVQFKEIASKVHTSSTIKKFLIETNSVKIKPLRDDILGVIHSIFYFTFAKAEKISIGSAILLSKWHQEVAIPNGINDNIHLNQTLFDIIEKCADFKINLSNSETFFSKFRIQVESTFKSSIAITFNPDNVFAEIAYKATENQIRLQNLEHPIGKLDCYIFYSTYISLLTSYLHLSNTDNVDIYLREGLNSYLEFLRIEEDSFNDGFEYYLKARSTIFVKCIQVIGDVDFKTSTNIPLYIRLFEAEDFTELDEVDDSNYNDLFKYFEFIKENLVWINSSYGNFKSRASLYKLETWEEGRASFFVSAPDFIEKLVILPFEESRCNICGDFELRENLEILPVSSDGEGRLLPVCQNCKTKYIESNGWLELDFIG